MSQLEFSSITHYAALTTLWIFQILGPIILFIVLTLDVLVKAIREETQFFLSDLPLLVASEPSFNRLLAYVSPP